MKSVIKSLIILALLQGNINIATAQSSAELWNECQEALDLGYKPTEVKACNKFTLWNYQIPQLQKVIRNIYDQELALTLLPCKYKNCIEYPSIYPVIIESVLELSDPHPHPSLPNDLLLESAIELQNTLKGLVGGLDIYIMKIQ